MTIQRIASGGLRITALEIRNLWGVAEAIIRPGQRNIIRGANGCGKSSVLRAVQLALGGGTLGKYQRIGAGEDEPPEIVLEISGPKDFIRIEREGDKPAKVLRRVGDSEAFERVPAPATFLKGLFDVRGANPFAFLEASDDDRAQLLLEALDVAMDEAALAELLGEDAALAASIPSSLHPLTRLALIHDAVYGARRALNVDADSKSKSAEQLKRSVPAERFPDLANEIETLSEDIDRAAREHATKSEANRREELETIATAQAEHAAESKTVADAHEREVGNLKSELAIWAAEVRAKAEAEIAAKEREVAAEIERLGNEEQAVLDKLHGDYIRRSSGAREHGELIARELDVEAGELATKKAALAVLRERQAESQRHDALREQIAKFEALAAESEAGAKRLTKKLEGLEALKRQLASNLPIPGLDISGKEIRVNGVRWQDLNAGQQGAIAGIVAVARAKRSRLPVVFFDEAERFDDAHIDAIARVVEEAGAQLFAAVVARDGEIVVEADGVPVGTVRVDAPADPIVSR